MSQRSCPHPVRGTRRRLLGLGSLAIAPLILPACFNVGAPQQVPPQLGSGSNGIDSGTEDDSGGSSEGGAEPDGNTGSPVDPDTGASCVSADAGITVVGPEPTAVEGGEPVGYTVVLDVPPCADVTITMSSDAQLEVGEPLVFTPQDWEIPQEVWVTAVHDFEREADHFGIVTHTAESDDLGFDGLPVDDTTVFIGDRAHLAHVSVPLVGEGTNADSRAPRVSEDGRWVAFLSDASNLGVGDGGLHTDAFLRDLDAGMTVRISEGLGGEADGATTAIDMSADGSIIGFFSEATNLGLGPVSSEGEIYVWDSEGGLTRVTGPCDSCSEEIAQYASVSSDGAFVSFSTRRTVTGGGALDNDGELDVFTVRLSDLQVTHDSLNGSDQNGTFFWGSNAGGPVLSRDGTYLGFSAAAHNLDVPEITVQNSHAYVKDRVTRELTRASRHNGSLANCDGIHRATGSGNLHPSADGSVAVFTSACAFVLAPGEAADQAGFVDVFVREIAAMTTTRISVAHNGAEANGDSALVDISDDARYVLFRSEATNIVPGDVNGAEDLFVHDRTTGLTTRVAYGEAYEPLVSGVDVRAAISADGAWVVFATRDALLPSDGNDDELDVYRVQLR